MHSCEHIKEKRKRMEAKKGKVQKVTKSSAYISCFCRQAPREPILAIFCTSREMADIITRDNFGVYRLRGHRYTGGRILAFPVEMASYH